MRSLRGILLFLLEAPIFQSSCLRGIIIGLTFSLVSRTQEMEVGYEDERISFTLNSRGIRIF